MGDSQNAVIRAAEQNARIIASQKKKKDGETKRAISAQKKSDAAAKRAAAAGKKSAGGRGGRFRSVLRSAGYRAAARGHRGIVIKSHKNGKGFKGLIDYSTDPSKSPQFVFSNCGSDAHAAMVAMIQIANRRQDIAQPVGHITASLPPQIGRNEERWSEIVAELRASVGLDDRYPAIAIRHADADHDHIHLIYSRVGVAGEVFDQWGIKLKCAAAEERIEQKFGLKLFPRDLQKQQVPHTKNEIEMGLRTSALPPRAQIASALQVATQGRPTVEQFVERLQASGIGVRANVSATTGKMNGFSFTYSGISFSGSQISKNFGWKALSETIDYDQTRDTQFLAGLDGGTGRAGRDLAIAIATADGLNRAVEQVSPAALEPAGHTASPAPAADRAVPASHQGDRQAAQVAASKDAVADRAAGGDDLDTAADSIYIAQRERTDAARADLLDDAPLTSTTGAPDGQTRLSRPLDTDHDDAGRTSGGDTAASASRAPAFAYVARPRPAAARVRGVQHLSELAMAPDTHRDQVLLRPNALDRVGHEPATPDNRVRRATDKAVTAKPAAKPAATVRPINKIPVGFAASKPLSLDLKDWAARLPNRIAINRKSARLILDGLMDDRSRALAVSTNKGYAITDPKLLTDEQIMSLLDDPEVEQPIELHGTPDFCARVEQIARRLGITTRHDHQVTRAAEQQRQDDQRDQDADLAVPEFRP